MDRVDRKGVVLDRCPAQHGFWFDAGELEEYALKHGKHVLAEKGLGERMHVSRDASMECPHCGTATLESGAIGQFDLSVCTRCRGLFLPFRSTNRLRLVSKPSKARVVGDVAVDALGLLDLVQFVFWS
jgi:Zn-finger nucleic acid-binding protein